MVQSLFDVEEVIEIACQIERNGAAFYRRAAELVDSQESKAFLVQLAEMEDNHEITFENMRGDPLILTAILGEADGPAAQYLQAISSLDLSKGPSHHLIFTFSHEAGGKSEGDDGVVTVKSQLTASAQRNATALYGIADNHTGVPHNPCTVALVTAILQDGTTRATIQDCQIQQLKLRIKFIW